MADRERSLSLTGFPLGYTNIRVQLWAEKHSGPATVENVIKQDDSTTIVFRDIEGLQKFCSANIDSVEFGGSRHKLEMLRPEKIEQGESDDKMHVFLRPSCDKAILRFVFGNEEQTEALRIFFMGIAELEFSHDEDFQIKFTRPKQHNAEEGSDFKEKCRKNLCFFFENYITSHQTFKEDKLNRARKNKLLPKISSTPDDHCIVCWKDDGLTVEVTGVKSSVGRILKEIVDQVNTIILEKETCRICLGCGIVDELQRCHPNMKIECNEDTCSLKITGNEKYAHNVHLKALEMLNEIHREGLSDLDENVVSFITGSLSYGSALDVKLHKELKAAGVKGVLVVDEKPLRVVSKESYRKAIDVIKQTIVVEEIKIDEPESNRNFHKWIGRRKGLFEIKIRPNGSIEITGVKEEVHQTKQKIQDFLDAESVGTTKIPMNDGAAQFITQYSSEFSPQACGKKGIKCELSKDKGGGVCLTGKKKALDSAKSELEKIWRSISDVPMELNHPGIREYCTSDKARQFFTKTAQETNCVILDKSSTDQENVPEFSKEQLKLIEQSMAQAYSAQFTPSTPPILPKPQKSAGTCTIQLFVGDIVFYQADVIVNPTTPQFLTTMATGPVISKKLAEKAGLAVQKQCQDLQPPHTLGKVFETDGGGLPCQKLYHALIDDYDANKSKSIIDSVVSECLKMADQRQFRSIAFPAIATGGFGHPPNLVAKWMKQQISKFSGQYLKTVIIVLFPRNKPVINAFYAEINSSTSGALPTPIVSSQQSGPALNIQLVTGDIVSQQADVIVNVTTPQFLTDMASGPAIARALAQKAGPNVLQQCKGIQPPHDTGKVYETSGGGLPCTKLYHALVSDYDSSKSKSIIDSLVSESLKMAENDKYSSIAFPAIATGGFQHPPNLVAKWMKQQIQNFRGQHVKTVFIVLYIKNQAVIDSFQAEFMTLGIQRSPSPQYPKTDFGFLHTILSRSKKKKSIASSMSFGPLMVSVYRNDIVSESSDVMVNSTNTQFDLTKGVISSQLLNKGGQNIQLEVMSERGNVCRVTSGGELSCKRIIHFVAPQTLLNVRLMIGKALQEVEDRRLSSVSIPFFWTDNFEELGTKVIAKEICNSISEFVAANWNIKYLDEVKIVVWGKTDLQLVEQHILGAPVKGRATKVDSRGDTFKLFIFSTDKKSIDNAVKCIKKKMENVFQKQYVKNDAIPRLTGWENFEIAEVEKNNNIRISANRHTKKMELFGMRKNIAKAAEEIKEIMQDFTAAETSAKYVSWQKKNADKWENYAARSAYALETAFMTRQSDTSAPTTVKVPEFRGGLVSYHTVDFSPLFDGTSKAFLEARRRITEDLYQESAILSYPSTWDMMGKNEQKREVTLTRTSQEYKDVLTKFHSSGPAKATIVSIERIQNKTLYEQYAAKKSGVATKLKNHSNPIVRQLFHGTDADDKIIIHGFDRGYAGKNATVYGFGVYFARDASFSDIYASANSKGEKRMFLANVITGRYCKGHSEMKYPPPIQNGDGTDDIYDSVVDKLENPSIFVIFRDISAYPAYRITYKLT